jgi:hypothetical protein
MDPTPTWLTVDFTTDLSEITITIDFSGWSDYMDVQTADIAFSCET